ncbi:hypothetical protein SSX86_004210 [Deinandra increscens subsp. villosa]|uniref:BRCT domain-containing protein n=1 Tax=Deinandra increscens subsp. villosa TaxID=3103831 RepID=A0AAP0DIT6_9ASTR
MARKKPSSSASASPIAIGNCEVVVESKNFTTESDQNRLQISLSRNSKIVISGYYFVLVNPKDSDAQSKSLLQEILALYMKELPSMTYAANTGKKSTFLERCVSNGKYCTLVLQSKSRKSPGEVIAAISFQIIPADTRFAEVPLAAVSAVYQHKGIGQLTYLEMRKRLQSVGVHSIFCWADVESEAFWFKQGFVPVGKVDDNGRARRLPIKADIRKSLCFPGGSTLMIAHLPKEYSDNAANSSQDLVCLYSRECIDTGNSVDDMRTKTDGDANHCSCSSSGAKKRTWEASHTSLNSKKVKGSHLIVCQSNSGCVSRSNKSNGCRLDVSPATISMDNDLADVTPTIGGPLTNDNTQKTNCYKIMLMNIVDDAKKSNLTKIIEDLGGSVTSDGRVSTHVITGKVRKTLNICTALCSGAWIISSAWLKESCREGRFVDEMPYILKDDEYESKYRTDLKSTVLRARGNTGGFLKGFQVCLAAHVQPPINTLSAIVRSAGGNVIRNLEKVNDPKRSIFVASEDTMEEASSAIKKGIATFTSKEIKGILRSIILIEITNPVSSSDQLEVEFHPKMAAETSHFHHFYGSRRRSSVAGIRLGRRLLIPAAASSQPMDTHATNSYKHLGMFSLRKKIEDSVNRAEMLGRSALEFEEARQIKQEEMVREYDLWDDLAKSSDILIKLADSAKVVDGLKDLTYKVEEAKLITELAEMDIINYALLKQAYTASVDVSKFLNKYEMSKLLKGKYEFEGACIIVEAGSEGIRSEIWAEQLVGMYMKWAKKQGLNGRIVEKNCGSKAEGAIKSVIIEFEQKYAYGYFLGEKGTHRMITCHPESLSEVSSAAVDIVPLFLEETPEVNVEEKDLQINYIQLCENGRGQKRSIIQIQHLPTGLTVHSSGERNQFSNKMKALNRLKAKLLVISKDQGVSNITKIEKDSIIDHWHQETRRYVFRPYKLVQDVKTGIQLADPNFVLNGNLDPFISAHINNRHVCDLG